ncbi:hypothetical protein SEA_CLOWN_29 [Gordonia phage Clown]|uniref:Uncharacterized protein n=1 Tax=Gordonia phage Clown TaxID=2759393 RepID=A0A7L7SPE5_9CAUD|nr:hypothetical protein KNV25_gp29 [Gordonia phage Clown]QOC56027.1 hypothetical protein SEA_CLOWN_29 [Gordonia phage Clown]
MSEITIKAEQHVGELEPGTVVTVERTPKIDQYIEQGRVTVVDPSKTLVNPTTGLEFEVPGGPGGGEGVELPAAPTEIVGDAAPKPSRKKPTTGDAS